MSAVSAVPAALGALVAGLQAWPGLAGCQVIDGPPTSDLELPIRALIIGASEDPDDVLAAASDHIEVGLGPRAVEGFEIFCNAVIWTGGADLPVITVRTAAYALLDEVAAYLTSDRRLGGTVNRAALTGNRQLGQRSTADGAGAAIAFSIRCTARP